MPSLGRRHHAGRSDHLSSFMSLVSSLWSRVYRWRPWQSRAGSPMMLVGQVILQKWDSKAVLWVQILASSQTKRSDGLSKSQTRRKVWRKYLKKRTSKQHYRMEGTTRRGHRLTRVARGIRQWEGVWLGQWSRVIGGVRSDTDTGMLCHFHLGLKTSVDALSGNTARGIRIY